MVSTKSKKQINKKTKKTKLKKYKPLNLSVKQFRNDEEMANDEPIKYFLNHNPTSKQMNKLYDTTLFFAASDSIGEMWSYVHDFTREQFDILCKIIKNNLHVIIQKENHKNYKENKKINYETVQKQYLIPNILSTEEYSKNEPILYHIEYICIAYNLLVHLRVL